MINRKKHTFVPLRYTKPVKQRRYFYMGSNNQTPFIDSKLLILLFIANSLLFGYLKIYYENNAILRVKIEIIWLLIKALIILLNSRYMYKLVYNLTHDQDISVSFWSIIRNTHLLSCICTFMAFLLMIG